MDRPETVTQLLNAFGVTSDRPLGSGQESDVFAIDDRRVLRPYRHPSDQRHLARLASFYARLDRRNAPFTVPEMIEFGERHGFAYAVEVRISGIDLAQALGRMEGEARFRAIRNYVDAAAVVRSLKHPQTEFGEVLAASPARRETWAEFVVARANVWASTAVCLSEYLSARNAASRPWRPGSRPAPLQPRAWFMATASRRMSWLQMMAASAAH